MSFIVCNELYVNEDDVESFERNFGASMRGTLPEVAGLIGARLLRPKEEGRGYLSVLEFIDEGAYDTYLSSDAFVAAHRWPEHAPFDHNHLSSYDTLLTI
jgi:heme-degrading monooxygenase HmoA